MTVYFISRHAGALDWAKEQNIHFDIHLTHLDNLDGLNPNDIIIGTLPINMVADLNMRQIRYVHLSLRIPAKLRGIELNAEQLRLCQIQLQEFSVNVKPFLE